MITVHKSTLNCVTTFEIVLHVQLTAEFLSQ